MATMTGKMRRVFCLAALPSSLLLTVPVSAAETCGDGIFDNSSEACDDGNTQPDDGCDANCEVECTEVGKQATEHTCLHGSNGPFADVGSSLMEEPATVAVSTPHTYFTVALRGDPGANLSQVLFQPSADGTYAVYMKKAYPFRLLNDEGEEPKLILEHAISSCASAESLTWVRVFEGIDTEQTYTVELGPYEENTMSFAFEHLGFLGPRYRDRDMDGHATVDEAASTWCAPPSGYSYDPGQDCDDADPLTFPGAPELCDGSNSDCDGRTDDDEAGLCPNSELGAVCASFDAATRCGCHNNGDCTNESTCSAGGRCEAQGSGGSGEGGAPAGAARVGGSPSMSEAGSGQGADKPEAPQEGGAGSDAKSSGGNNNGKDSGAANDAAAPSGLGCSLPTPKPSSPGWLVLALLVLFLLRRRATQLSAFLRNVGSTSLLVACLGLTWTQPIRAAVPPDCKALGSALTEHSCFHSTLGPFEFREPSEGDTVTDATPNVDPVHTEYRVLLKPGKSSLTYKPERAGSFAFFTGYDVPITVRSTNGAPLDVVFRATETGCAPLPLARVFELEKFKLEERVTYVLTFDSDRPGEVPLVIEYVDDFLTRNGVDRDGDGYGDPSEVVVSVCVPPDGYASNSADCDDQNAAVHPDAVELCGDEVDQNCNGLPDDTGLTCRVGSGACLVQGTLKCPSGGTAQCDTAQLEPTAETCNGVDDDCDGQIDEGSALCPDGVRPRCVRLGFSAQCGCQFDADCTDAGASSRVCDTALGECVQGDQGSSGGAQSGTGGDDALGGEPNVDEDDLPEAGCSCRIGRSLGRRSAPFLSLVVGWALLAWRGASRKRNACTRPGDE
jgi:MYXO-CTERM domain-containing protein